VHISSANANQLFRPLDIPSLLMLLLLHKLPFITAHFKSSLHNAHHVHHCTLKQASGVTKGGRKGGRPPAQVKMGAQN